MIARLTQKNAVPNWSSSQLGSIHVMPNSIGASKVVRLTGYGSVPADDLTSRGEPVAVTRRAGVGLDEPRAPYDPMPHGPPEVGVGPWAGPWPDGEEYDARLLAEGDRRNVVDRYRYWTMEAIVADLDPRRHDFHVAIENWQHDFNIGTIVRSANAFLAAEVHIVGNRRWNRRGAMVTDRYQHLRHHATVGRPGGVPARARRDPARRSTTSPAPPPRDDGDPAVGLLPVRPGGARPLGGGARGVRRHLLDRPVRLDTVDQRLRRGRDRHARLDPHVRRPVAGGDAWRG